ncbi:growth-regulating factor 5-like isoform X1 [Zingiber officinale]|uniref:growth-regulating factor 5-like isoform X1 n=1 Tax=Zingiber officinale TaxID=94328 RepID=UPI001C4D93EC|nr:growth-regulating factor 5-like isoform X1 [Zingiber officinale]
MGELKGASFSLESSLPLGLSGFPMNTSAAAAGFGARPPFTAAQWQELEHQALIYKYLTAGVPVPPELLIPIRRSFEALPGRYWHHPALAYCSYYGKKLDPEPGRCRRTDGKKWRCSKDAHPDSKYCERHMHRGRNRSRKPVESQSQPASQLQSSSTTVTAASSSGAGGSGGGNSQSINPQHSVASHVNAQSLCLGGSSLTQLSMDTGPYVNSCRYFSGVKPGVDEHSFFLETTGNARSLVLDSVDSSWCLTPSRVSSFPLLKTREPSSLLQSSYPQLQSLQDNIGQVAGSSTSRQQQQQQQQQQQSFMSSEFGSTEPKHESQFLRPFFDEWPKARDSWSDIEEDKSNRTSFSTTQLSMSFPMASSSDFSTTSSRSPNGESVLEIL